MKEYSSELGEQKTNTAEEDKIMELLLQVLDIVSGNPVEIALSALFAATKEVLAYTKDNGILDTEEVLLLLERGTALTQKELSINE